MIARITTALTQFVKPVSVGQGRDGGASSSPNISGQSGQGGATLRDHGQGQGQSQGQPPQKQNQDQNAQNQQKSELPENAKSLASSQSESGAKITRLAPIAENQHAKDDAANGAPPPEIPNGQSVSHTFFQLFEAIQKRRNQAGGGPGSQIYAGGGKAAAKSRVRFKKGAMLDHKAS